MFKEQIEDLFWEHRSFRTRDSIGLLHDEVRPCMFEKELVFHLSKEEIKKALNKGLIKPIKIADPQGCIRNAYLCCGVKMKQHSFFKRALAFLFPN